MDKNNEFIAYLKRFESLIGQLVDCVTQYLHCGLTVKQVELILRSNLMAHSEKFGGADMVEAMVKDVMELSAEKFLNQLNLKI